MFKLGSREMPNEVLSRCICRRFLQAEPRLRFIHRQIGRRTLRTVEIGGMN